MKLYTGLCLLVLTVLAVILFTRNDITATVMRTPGILYQEKGEDTVSNLYNIKVVNKTIQSIPLTVKLENTPGSIQMVGNAKVQVEKEGQGAGSFFILLPRNVITNRKTELKVGLYQGDKKITTVKTTFLGPVAESK
jgi:hypothetical protein